MTAPHPDGIGVVRVMENCLRDAGLKPEDVDAINTHGTSTPLGGDVAELKRLPKYLVIMPPQDKYQFDQIYDRPPLRSRRGN